MLGDRRLVLAVLLGAAACGDRDAHGADSARAALVARCGRAADAVLRPAGVGPIRLDQTLDEAGALCPVTRARHDSAAAAEFEGHPVVLDVRDGRIAGFTVDDPAFRTDRGVGVGSALGTLRDSYGPICALSRGRALRVQVAGLSGIAFDVGSLPHPADSARPLPRDDLTDSVRITRVVIGDLPSPCPPDRVAPRRSPLRVPRR